MWVLHNAVQYLTLDSNYLRSTLPPQWSGMTKMEPSGVRVTGAHVDMLLSMLDVARDAILYCGL